MWIMRNLLTLLLLLFCHHVHAANQSQHHALAEYYGRWLYTFDTNTLESKFNEMRGLSPSAQSAYKQTLDALNRGALSRSGGVVAMVDEVQAKWLDSHSGEWGSQEEYAVMLRVTYQHGAWLGRQQLTLKLTLDVPKNGDVVLQAFQPIKASPTQWLNPALERSANCSK